MQLFHIFLSLKQKTKKHTDWLCHRINLLGLELARLSALHLRLLLRAPRSEQGNWHGVWWPGSRTLWEGWCYRWVNGQTCDVFLPHHQAILKLPVEVLQFNSILPLSTWRWGRSHWGRPTSLSPPLLQMPIASPDCKLCCWPTGYKAESPPTPPLVWLIC